jgi:hypothetical protein
MFRDVISAIHAGCTMAPAVITRRDENWLVYNPAPADDETLDPKVLVTEDGMLMALNPAGQQVLATLAFTGGSA